MPDPTLKRGAIASPRSALAAATPFRPLIGAPANVLMKPARISMWGNDAHGDCVTAEEAFAKACNSPEIFIQDDQVIAWATRHGVLDGAYLTQVMTWMQNDGFTEGSYIYDDGPYVSVDWSNAGTLRSAISQGPVKIGIAADQLEDAWHSTGGQNGWFATGFRPDNDEDHCVALCGYGSITWLAQQLGVAVPHGIDGAKPGYALFTWNSIGIIDVPSMVAITHEAWLRRPTTVIVESIPAGPTATGAQMQPGETLAPGQQISSASGRYTFVYQTDGNLVLYGPSGALWASNTDGRPTGVCIMQDDGNLVIYTPGPHPIWASNTDGNPGAHLIVQDDGNVVIYAADGHPVWDTGTWVPTGPTASGDDMQPGEVLTPGAGISSADGRYSFVYQSDGNLVLYGPRGALWASNTDGRPTGVCIMQSDGNLVVYAPGGSPLWASNTDGNPGAHLIVQDDGNVVVYASDGHPVWDTGTWVPTGPTATGDDMQPGEVLTPSAAISSADGRYTFVYQSDSNLVLYGPSGALWASNTDGRPTGVCIMQGDGNLVVYAPGGSPLWASNTDGNPGAHLIVQTDGNVVIYAPDGHPAWDTGTWARADAAARAEDTQAGKVLTPERGDQRDKSK